MSLRHFLEPPLSDELLLFNLIIVSEGAPIYISQLAHPIILGPLLLMLQNILLEPLLQDIILLLDLMFITIDSSLPIHCIFIQAISIKILLIDWILDIEVAFRELFEEINDKSALRHIFLKHSKNKILEVAGIRYLKWERLLIEDLTHEALDILIIEGHFKCGHIIHYNPQTEYVRPMVIRLLLDDFWTQVKWGAHLLGLQVSLLVDHGALA